MTVDPYPLRTEPLFRDYLWGGRNLGSRLNKAIPPSGIWAESWEVIDHPEHRSVVTNGRFAGKSLRDIMEWDPQWLLGGGATKTTQLPLLLKYLDCQRVLSVQVHPDDIYGLSMPKPDLGKTEAWYVIDAAPGAVLYAGLKHGVTREQLRQACEGGFVADCLHTIRPRAGDCVFIPAGTVHALGEGLLVAEIQQASNTTFRLFDWNRTDPQGKPRELHVAQALEVTDYQSGPRSVQVPQRTDNRMRERLVSCEKFVFDRITGPGEIDLAADGRFHLLTCPQGTVTLIGPADHREILEVGESVVVPAAYRNLLTILEPESVLLDMYLPS